MGWYSTWYMCCISLRFVSLCYAVLFCALALIIVVQPFWPENESVLPMVLIILLEMISYVHLICEPFSLLNISLSACDECVCMIQSLDGWRGRRHWLYIKFIFIRSLEILKETLTFFSYTKILFSSYAVLWMCAWVSELSFSVVRTQRDKPVQTRLIGCAFFSPVSALSNLVMIARRFDEFIKTKRKNNNTAKQLGMHEMNYF